MLGEPSDALQSGVLVQRSVNVDELRRCGEDEGGDVRGRADEGILGVENIGMDNLGIYR